jgi:PAS domain S-box-containing protein
MTRTPSWLDGSVDYLDVAVVIVGEDRTIAYANQEAHRMFGAHAGRLPGLNMDRLALPERRGELRNIEDVLSGGGARRVRTALRRDDGTRVTVTATYEPCQDDHGRMTSVAIRYELLAAGSSLKPSLFPPGASLPPFGSTPPLGHLPHSQPPESTHRPASGPPRDPLSGPPPIHHGGVPGPYGSTPPPRHSERRLAPFRHVPEIEGRLRELDHRMRWLEERLSALPQVSSLDDPRERARALLVVAEARTLIQETLDATGAGEHDAMTPPRIPKI